MASTKGYSQWEKYYKGKGDLNLVLKKSIIVKTLDGKSGPLIKAGEIIILLEIKSKEEYYSYSNSKSTNATAWLPIKWKNTKYLCNIDAMSKPKESGAIDMKLQTSNLIKGGIQKKYDLMGQKNVSCMSFTNASMLRKSCISYIKGNKLLDQNKNLKASLIGYFENNNSTKIDWIGGVSDKEMAQFKYLGEVAIGLVLLEGKTQAIVGDSPFKSKIKEVIYPVDESFHGADSFIRVANGDIYPISSKLDKGAAASFWVNVFPKILANIKYQTPKILRDLCDCARAIGITDEKSIKTSAKKIVYEYGVRKLLKVKKNEIKESYQVYQEFLKHDNITEYSIEVREIFNQLKMIMKQMQDETALKNLDSSTTVFFSKIIAKELNSSKESIEIILKILTEKSYYQANQDLKKLKEGIVHFHITKSGGGTIEFIGTKSAYTNIEASQGTVNYIIKK